MLGTLRGMLGIEVTLQSGFRELAEGQTEVTNAALVRGHLEAAMGDCFSMDMLRMEATRGEGIEREAFRLTDHEVIDAMVEAVRSRRLRMVVLARPHEVVRLEPEKPKAPVRVLEAGPTTTWIEIAVKDALERPAVGVRYSLVRLGGKVRRGGMIGESGVVRVEGLEAGRYVLTFPETEHGQVEVYRGGGR